MVKAEDFLSVVRHCEVCIARGDVGVPAVFVAKAPDGRQWFECEAHRERPADYRLEAFFREGVPEADVSRLKREPIGEWYRRVERWSRDQSERRRRDTEPVAAEVEYEAEPVTVELHPFEALPGVTRFRVPPGFEGVTLVFVNSGDTPRDVFAFVTEDELFYGSLSEEHGEPGASTSLAGVADALARSGETGNALDVAPVNGVARPDGAEGLEAESEDESI